MTKKLYLIDGSGFIFRAYYALPPLTRGDGTPIGAVLGFTNMLIKLLNEEDAHEMAVIFDAGRETFRHDIYASYKANREETPDDLIPQFPLIRQACHAFNVPVVEQKGYEADDIIATYTKEALAQGYEVTIVSSDKDLMQLVGPNVIMYDQMKDRRIGIEQVAEKYGVRPDQLGDVLALAGDASDNIPGVPGIGPKTAAELIQKYGSLSQLYENIQEIKQPKRRQSLEENEMQAFLSRKLVSLHENVSVPLAVNQLQVGAFDADKIVTFLKMQGFKSLLGRLKMGEGAIPNTSLPTALSHNHEAYHLVTTIEALTAFVKQIERKGVVALKTICDADRKLVGIVLSCEKGIVAYIPTGHTQRLNLEIFAQANGCTQLPLSVVLGVLKSLFTDEGILKIGHHIKEDLLTLEKEGISLHHIGDTMVLASMLGPGKNDLSAVVERYFDHKLISLQEVLKRVPQAKMLCALSPEMVLDFAASQGDYILRLWLMLYPQLYKAKSFTPYETIDKPLIPVLAEMERTGIKVDGERLARLSKEFSKELEALEQQIYELAGGSFNIGSPKQLGEVLFDKLQLVSSKKTKSGGYGTGADILEKLAHEGNKVAQLVLDWRHFSKLKTTYTDTLLHEINPRTSRVHTCYMMAIASTGRLSSMDPNLQNIPVRTDAGRKIRAAFIAPAGSVLISLDYSQIELRLLAYMAEIKSLEAAFKEGKDIHALTASQVFGVPLEAVDSLMRRHAKTINFGIIYGMSAFGLAKQLEIPTGEAAAYIAAYKKQYPGITHYMETTIEFARRHGYVETLFGRRCYVPLITAKNPMQRQGAERQAINARLQGTAADIIKRAMIHIPAALKKERLNGKMLLQVHDELVFEAPDAEKEAVATLAKKIMERAPRLPIPFIVDVGMGPNWEAAH